VSHFTTAALTIHLLHKTSSGTAKVDCSRALKDMTDALPSFHLKQPAFLTISTSWVGHFLAILPEALAILTIYLSFLLKKKKH